MKSKFHFQKISNVFVVLFLTFLLVYGYAQEKGKPWPTPESAVKMKNPVSSNDESIAAGKALYAKHCKSCHGTKGKGDGPKAANLDVSSGDFTSAEFTKKSDGELFWKTSEGRDPMPTFKKKMGDEERWQVIQYIRTFDEKKK